MKQDLLPFDGAFARYTQEDFEELLSKYKKAVNKRKSFESKNSKVYYLEYQIARSKEMEIFGHVVDYLVYLRPPEKVWSDIIIGS